MANKNTLETKKSSLPILIAVAIVVGILAAASFVINKQAPETTPVATEETTETAEDVVVETKTLPGQDEATGSMVIPPEAGQLPIRALGNKDAPIVIEEYTSLTCSHCAEFYKTNYAKLKSDYIDTGKVYYIVRDYPLDRIALTGATLSRCLPEDKFIGYRHTLMDTFDQWTRSSTPEDAIKQAARLAGLSAADTDACLANEELKKQILADQQAARLTYNVLATPSFVFNKGEKLITGNSPEIFYFLDAKLGQAPAASERVWTPAEKVETEATTDAATETPAATDTTADEAAVPESGATVETVEQPEAVEENAPVENGTVVTQ